MIELEKKDWARVKTEAEHQLKQALVMLKVNQKVLAAAEAEINKFPEEPKEEKPKDANPA